MDGSTLIVNPLTADEFPEAAVIYRNSWHFLVELSGEVPDSIGMELVTREVTEASTNGAIFAGIRLKENRQLVGVVTYQLGGYRGQPSQAWIALLMVAEQFQSLGYGGEAYRLVEEAIFTDPGISTISLGVLTNNPKALKFWQKMGYSGTDIRTQGDTAHDILVMKKLRSQAGG